eukprot:5452390-Amphidinium_carterae.1
MYQSRGRPSMPCMSCRLPKGILLNQVNSGAETAQVVRRLEFELCKMAFSFPTNTRWMCRGMPLICSKPPIDTLGPRLRVAHLLASSNTQG